MIITRSKAAEFLNATTTGGRKEKLFSFSFEIYADSREEEEEEAWSGNFFLQYIIIYVGAGANRRGTLYSG